MSRKNISLAGRLITSQDPLLIGGGQGDEPANFKQLTNLRYGDQNPQGIRGHTKINATALATYLKTRNGFHFKKDFPAESHVVIQAENTGETESKIWQNTTAIPGTGNFSPNHSSVGHTTDAIHTDDSSAGLGRFSDAPQGFLAYCNGAESMIWGGDESRVASFIRFDPDDNAKKWDYTDQISNTLTTDVATLVKSGGSLDSSDVLLLHLDNNVTDSETSTTHTVTNNNATFSSASKKFGTHSAFFNGTTAYLTVPDNSDFDFSGGVWTIDFWILFDTQSTESTLYYQETDDSNYTRIWLDHGSETRKKTVRLDIYEAGSPIVQVSSATDALSNVGYQHVAIVESGNDYFIFINGTLSGSSNVADTPNNETGLVHIGFDNNGGIGTYYDGGIDEFRVSKGVARWTSQFTPQDSAYPVNGAEVYLGSILPIQGAKLYVGTANTTASTAAVSYWDGSSWTPVSNIADTTEDPAGDTLGQTGTISFDDTSSVAKPRSIDNMFLYWYRFSFPSIDDTTTVYHASVDIAFQDIKDIWDGTLRTPLAALEWDDTNSKYKDHIIEVFEDRYDASDSASFATLSTTWSAANEFLLFGFAERASGMSFNTVSGKGNAVTAAMSVNYWDGDSWVSVGTLQDNTVQDGKALGKSGFVTWNAPALGSEVKRQDLSSRRTLPKEATVFTGPNPDYSSLIDGTYGYLLNATKKGLESISDSVKKEPYQNAQSDYPLYFYQVKFNASIDDSGGSNGVEIYNVAGIPAPGDLKNYSFPSVHNERLFLSDNVSQHRNEEICSSVGTVNVFNGIDSTVIRYGGGGKLIASSTLFVNYRDNVNSIRVVFKENEIWALFGSSNENWIKLQVSDSKGCVAPLTLQRFDVVVGGSSVQVLIFQGSNGIHMFDGKNVIDIDDDIRDVFKATSSTRISPTRVGKSTSYYDSTRQEYHWLWTKYVDGAETTHDMEYVFDVKRFKWFTVDRGTGAYLQCGYSTRDTDGNTYSYGMIDTGHAVRDDNDTTFAKTSDTNEITHTMWLGDFVPSLGVETKLENINLVGKAVTETDTISIDHYGDGKTAASSPATVSETQVSSGRRIFDARMSAQKGGYFSHSLKFTVTTGSETTGFEPLALSLSYKEDREKGGR